MKTSQDILLRRAYLDALRRRAICVAVLHALAYASAVFAFLVAIRAALAPHCASAAVSHEDFARLSEDGKFLVRAPVCLEVGDSLLGESALTETDYVTNGWLRVVDVEPSLSSPSNVLVPTGWRIATNQIVRVYEERTPTVIEEIPGPRKFSKLKVYAAIGKLGAWEKVRAWLEAKEIDGVNGWMAFILAQELSEDNALFTPLAEEARQLLGLSDQEFETILSGCVLEE